MMKSFFYKTFILLALIQISSLVSAQNNYHFYKDIYSAKEQNMRYSASNAHSSLFSVFEDNDSLQIYKTCFTKKNTRLNPLYLADIGYDMSLNKPIFQFTGGIQAAWKSENNKWHFFGELSADFVEQSFYQQQFSDSMGTTLWGTAIEKRTERNSFTANFAAYAQYQATKYLNLNAGVGHYFIGDGYRSLLVADNSSSYPFGALEFNVWKLNYSFVIGQMKGHNSSVNFEDWKTKFTLFHYLDWNISENISLGFFETVIQSVTDSVGVRQLDVNYLDPFVFLRPVEFSVGSPDNVLVGLNFSWSIKNKAVLFGQIALDEFILSEIKAGNGWWGNKQAAQAGMKLIEPFGITGLFVQGEANLIRPFIYSHENTIEAYSHRSISMAHPLGANLIEILGIVSLEKSKWQFQATAFAQQYGNDPSADVSMGRDLNKPYIWRNGDYGHNIRQGDLQQVLGLNIKARYALKLHFPVYAILNTTAYQHNTTFHSAFQVGISSGIFPKKEYQF